MKMLIITSQGVVWELPANIVAEHRASYYSGRKSGKYYKLRYSQNLKESWEKAVLIDWVLNLDFPERLFKKYAKVVKQPKPELDWIDCKVTFRNKGV